MAKIDGILKPFACSICAKARALLAKELTKSQRARLLESISDDVKKCSNFVVPEVSRAALKEAKRLGVDICLKNWHDQPRFDQGRRKFHLEHFVPVSAIREECLDARTELKILKILKNRLRLVWILKSEDAKLTQLGFRSRRRSPKIAYRDARIELAKKDK
ncbi:MAG: hypothetical protein HY081_00880 [Gammaproteobacteria bacterium]|nr:hypothetical protein [Gammaproteobacteria bacterium]